MKRKLLQKLVPGLCASLVLVSATSLTGCSTDTKRAAAASDADKSETVYVKADASGTIHEIKVQTDLKNTGTSKEIKDFSKSVTSAVTSTDSGIEIPSVGS